jgi:hypothetical protein
MINKINYDIILFIKQQMNLSKKYQLILFDSNAI